MDQNTVIAIAVVVIGFFGFTYVSMQEIFKFRLKKEQIKADALVKTEQIKAQNQLEIEALIHKDTIEADSLKTDNDSLNERRNRLSERA